MRKVEGQEDSTLDFDGSMKITAFNMKEDMEDGHFDDAGNFIFDKKEKVSGFLLQEIKDAWLDDIDWTTIKQKAGDQWEQSNDKDDDDVAPPTLNDIRRKEIFSSLISRMKPNQTVAKALAELKKAKGLSAAEERKLRWKAKKEGKTMSETDSQKETQLISGLADELISAGHLLYWLTRTRKISSPRYQVLRTIFELHLICEARKNFEILISCFYSLMADVGFDRLIRLSFQMDVYEWTREKFEFLVKKLESTAVDSVDMFSDEPATVSSAQAAASSIMDEEEQQWEYKDSESSEIQGPFSSSEMARRQQNGKLSSTGLARKSGAASFNPVARIDFELYC
ncbi:unnamed protein product [Strongylus vulgaris]|uniref:GYF domain-containing protein n=1 Tax=Strongylus vulgaris TaxID=40348 RepID=A0A3P7I7R2_STRVU|nr:unnamed protein product [Strongylus vulgaris]